MESQRVQFTRDLAYDLRYALRMLRKAPGFGAVIVLVLGLGIGISTAIFSVVNTALLRPLPYPDSDRITMVFDTFPQVGIKKFGVGYLNIRDWNSQNNVFEAIAPFRAFSFTGFNITGGPQPERVQGTYASADFFRVLGVEPVLGRTFVAEDEQDGRDHVVVLGYELWQRYFNGDREAVGRTIKLNESDYTVCGVMPPSFHFPSGLEMPPGAQFHSATELWVPLVIKGATLTDRTAHDLRTVARLKSGVTLAQAQTEMNSIETRLQQEYPDSNQGGGIAVVTLRENQIGDLRPALLILLGAVGLVALIACANVANLLLARSAVRAREIAIRTALGASRSRIIRQSLAESIFLAVLGGAAGLLMAFVGIKLLLAMSPADLPRVRESSIDLWVLGFTLLLSLLTGLLSGLAPALHSSKTDLNETLKEGSRGSSGPRHRTREAIVVFEVALSLVLLIGAGLLLRSFARLLEVEPGFNANNVSTLRVTLPDAIYRGPKIAAYYSQALDWIDVIPGVEVAAVARDLPFSGSDPRYGATIVGRDAAAPDSALAYRYRVISPDYFDVMGIPLVKGRSFTKLDDQTRPGVAIINEALAQRYWPNQDPLGQELIGPSLLAPPQCMIVGIVGNVRFGGLDTEPEPELYYSVSQIPEPLSFQAIGSMALIVRTKAGAGRLLPAIRQALQRVDPDVPVSEVGTMEQALAASVAPRRFNLALLAVFAILALVLAAVGVYAVTSYAVTQRTREIGIMMALGARQRDVLRVVIWQGMKLVLIGLVIGLAGSFAFTRVMARLLYGIGATDPATFIAMALLFVLIALLANYAPARRAAKLDALTALRYE